MKINEILTQNLVDQEVTICGWIRSLRKSKKFSFLSINDGTCYQSLQVIADATLAGYEELIKLGTGACIELNGKVVASHGKGQGLELQAKEFNIVSNVEENFPLQKKATSLEFLREQAHLRVRTNTFSAVFRVRNVLAFATHQFFFDRGFIYVNTPIITGSDAEGAGDLFRVSTLNLENPPKNDQGKIDYDKDFFAKPTYLACTGQLEAEAFALGMHSVYTFGPTFRSENSNTPRHLAEFWMIEPEVAFADLNDAADLASDYIAYMCGQVLDRCQTELEFLQSNYEEGLIAKLTKVKESKVTKVSYTEAIELLEKCGKKFDFPVKWGIDLQTEHERFLAEEHFDGPVVVTDYPKDIKAFYMRLNDDQKTVAAMDLLVPGVGELVGGSQREERLDVLKQRIAEMKLPEEDYTWYLDLRRYGTAKHAGFGLGFERMVMFATGMNNIRDVIAFPRTPRNAEF